MSVRKLLENLKIKQQTAFIPYITVGDPNMAASEQIIKALIEGGANTIELGVPFSDPVADGITNQKSSQRALAHGTSLKDTLNLVSRLRSQGFTIPFILFSYFNPLFRMGINIFARRAKEAGLNAVLVVDLPPEEASQYQRCLQDFGLECIFLASPTTRENRLALIDTLSTGFIYYVSRTGVTGTQLEISTSLKEEMIQMRKWTRSPIGIGFGISTPAQAKSIALLGDGVIIGSAIVRLIEESTSVDHAIQSVREFSKQIVSAIQEVAKC